MSGKSKRVIGQLVRCTQCGELKEWQVGVFKGEKGKPRQPCVPCDTERRAKNADSNRDRERASARIRTRQYRERYPDRVQISNRKPRKINQKLANERSRVWKKAHPESAVTAFHQRKARLRELPSSFKRSDWLRCLAYWGNQCCICGRKSGDGYVIAQEHWIAVFDERKDNPGHVPWNILPMCHARKGVAGGCNNAKWTRDPVAWITDWLGHEKAAQKLSEIENYFKRCVASLEG